jgi:hypothetical protein
MPAWYGMAEWAFVFVRVLRLGGSGDTPEFIDECAAKVDGDSSVPTGGPASGWRQSWVVSRSHRFVGAQFSPAIATRLTRRNGGGVNSVLSGVSVILMLPAALLWRLDDHSTSSSRGITTYYRAIGTVIALVAYVLGVAGFAIGSSSTKSTTGGGGGGGPTTVSKLSTQHARAGIAFFAIAYCVLPVVGLILLGRRGCRKRERDVSPTPSGKSSSDDHELVSTPAPAPAAALTPRPSLKHKAQLSLTSFFGGSHETAAAAGEEQQPAKGFEVVNRRRQSQSVNLDRAFPSLDGSDNGAAASGNGGVPPASPPRDKRAASDAPYPTVMAPHHNNNTLPHTPPYQTLGSPTKPSSMLPLNRGAEAYRAWRPGLRVGRRFGSMLLQAVILFGIVYLLVTIYGHAVLFGLAIAWAVLYYLGLAVLAWTGRPSYESVLVILLSGFRSGPPSSSPPEHHRSAAGEEGVMAGGGGAAGVMVQQPGPPHRPGSRAPSSSFFSGRPMSDDSHTGYLSDADEDLDEEALQRRAEHEMSEREVIVMTVPRRQLRITN